MPIRARVTQHERIAAPSFRLKKSRTAVISPSARYLAQITSRVVLWDTVERRVVSAFKVIANERYVVFSPDERTLAVVNHNGEVVFWSIPSAGGSRRPGAFGPIVPAGGRLSSRTEATC